MKRAKKSPDIPGMLVLSFVKPVPVDRVLPLSPAYYTAP